MHYELDDATVAAPQGSPTWFMDRLGKLTASKANRAFDLKKDGSPGAQRKALILELAGERMTGIPASHYVTPAMQWGRDQEPSAKGHFTAATGIEIVDCGLYDHPTIDMLAASPDGLIGADGLIEIKCPTTATHLQWLLENDCPDDYMHQMTIQLACTGRQWCAFVSFDPRMPEPQRMRVWRFEPTPASIASVMDMATDFLALVDQMVERLNAPRTILNPVLQIAA